MFSVETRIAKLNYRINLLRARGETMNQNIINALKRELRQLEGEKK